MSDRRPLVERRAKLAVVQEFRLALAGFAPHLVRRLVDNEFLRRMLLPPLTRVPSLYAKVESLVSQLTDPSLGAPAGPDQLEVAASNAANQPVTAPRQLFVDISSLVRSDPKSGVQRVVRSILCALLANPQSTYRIEPVYSGGRGKPYRYARSFMRKSMSCAVPPELDDAPLELRAGDMFLGLDLVLEGTHQNRALLQDLRNRGVQIFFVVFDLLPVLRPDFFPVTREAQFADWLSTITDVADGLACISRAVADELSAWLAARPATVQRTLTVTHFHLGADIEASVPSVGLPPSAEQLLEQVRASPSLIMVGTIEPRKGHAQALAAFDALWADNIAVNLVIVGKQGWMVDALAARLRKHPAKGTRLFWLPDVSDEMLSKLYRASTALLTTSEGEGFCLPLIEAARHGLPIIARRLPVIEEVAGEHAYYFEGLAPAALANAVRNWMRLLHANQAPPSLGLRWLTWQESANQLLQIICAPR